MKVFQYFSLAITFIIASAVVLPVELYAQTPVDQQINNQVEDVQNNREMLQQDIQENQAQRQEVRDERIETRCSIATTRIDTITEQYANGTLLYVNRYNNLTDRLNNVIARLNEEGVDTTELNGYVQEISTLTTQFNNEMNQTIVTLQQTKSLSCGESEGAYLDVLQQSRSELLQARSTAVQINNIFLTDVVNELQDIRGSV